MSGSNSGFILAMLFAVKHPAQSAQKADDGQYNGRNIHSHKQLLSLVATLKISRKSDRKFFNSLILKFLIDFEIDFFKILRPTQEADPKTPF